jgi:hypothetical protein
MNVLLTIFPSDPQKSMPIHIIKKEKSVESTAAELEMLHNNKVLKRPLFNVPSGMEKCEEQVNN